MIPQEGQGIPIIALMIQEVSNTIWYKTNVSNNIKIESIFLFIMLVDQLNLVMNQLNYLLNLVESLMPQNPIQIKPILNK